jgi:hypothetical protein
MSIAESSSLTGAARDRVLRATACMIARRIWAQMLVEGFHPVEGQIAAERFVAGETSEAELDCSLLVAQSPEGEWPDPDALLTRGDLDGALSAAVKRAGESLCLPSAEDALEGAIRYTARAMAIPWLEEPGYVEPNVLAQIRQAAGDSGMLAGRPYREAWKRYCEVVWPVIAHGEGLLRQQSHDLVARGSTLVYLDHWVHLPEWDSVYLFALGLQLWQGPVRAKEVDDQNALFALVLRTPSLRRLWQRCTRDDWRTWLLDVARTWGIVDTHCAGVNPFEAIERPVLDDFRRRFQYAVAGRLCQLTWRDIVLIRAQ